MSDKGSGKSTKLSKNILNVISLISGSNNISIQDTKCGRVVLKNTDVKNQFDFLYWVLKVKTMFNVGLSVFAYSRVGRH